jgi:hypothetical protein
MNLHSKHLFSHFSPQGQQVNAKLALGLASQLTYKLYKGRNKGRWAGLKFSLNELFRLECEVMYRYYLKMARSYSFKPHLQSCFISPPQHV